MFVLVPMRSNRRRRTAFTLVELVMVVTIIGIVSAIAAPRMANAAKNATSTALSATLSTVRQAVDVYYAEHDQYPGYIPGSGIADGVKFIEQLTLFSNRNGDTSAAYSTVFRFGPYLRKPFPKNPTNNLATVDVKATPSDPNPEPGSVGWVAVLSHGYFGISATDSRLDDIGVVTLDGKAGSRISAG